MTIDKYLAIGIVIVGVVMTGVGGVMCAISLVQSWRMKRKLYRLIPKLYKMFLEEQNEKAIEEKKVGQKTD